MKKSAMVFLFLLFPLTSMAAPDPKVRELDALAGPFRCSGTVFASPTAPQHATTGDVTTKWDLDGHWLAFTYAEKKTAGNAMPFRVSGFFGYDPEVKQFVLGGVDNMGGYSIESSTGWNGDTIVFEGAWHMGTMTPKSRDTFTVKDHGMWHSAEIEQDGKWVKLGEETCSRK